MTRPIDVYCPTCAAVPGQPCFVDTDHGRDALTRLFQKIAAVSVHSARRQAAARLEAARQYAPPPPSALHIQQTRHSWCARIDQDRRNGSTLQDLAASMSGLDRRHYSERRADR